MLLPRPALAEFSEGAFDAPAGGREDDPVAGTTVTDEADVPPRLLRYETKASISPGTTLNATIPADFIAGVGVFKIAVN